MRFIRMAIAAFALIVATPLAADETAPDAPPRNPLGQLVHGASAAAAVWNAAP